MNPPIKTPRRGAVERAALVSALGDAIEALRKMREGVAMGTSDLSITPLYGQLDAVWDARHALQKAEEENLEREST